LRTRSRVHVLGASARLPAREAANGLWGKARRGTCRSSAIQRHSTRAASHCRMLARPQPRNWCGLASFDCRSVSLSRCDSESRRTPSVRPSLARQGRGTGLAPTTAWRPATQEWTRARRDGVSAGRELLVRSVGELGGGHISCPAARGSRRRWHGRRLTPARGEHDQRGTPNEDKHATEEQPDREPEQE
jgi:hypothetical protein